MHLCFVKKNNNKKTILSISDFCQQKSPVQVGILPGTKWRQMREYAFAKARGTCAISQGRCVSWNTAKLYRPNQIGLSGTISIRSRSLSGELPLRRVRARLLRVQLRRRIRKKINPLSVSMLANSSLPVIFFIHFSSVTLCGRKCCHVQTRHMWLAKQESLFSDPSTF